MGKFGDVLAEFQSMGYVNQVAFDPSGDYLAFLSQSSQISLVHFTGDGEHSIHTQQLKGLPLHSGVFTKAGEFIGAGHDKCCIKFTIKGDSFSEGEIIVGKKAKKKTNATSAAFAKFRNLADTGKETSKTSTSLHAFAITDLQENPDGGVTTIANGDNVLVHWN